jgi:hypothetical protein
MTVLSWSLSDEPDCKCPHCGMEFQQPLKDGLIPYHDWPDHCRQVCPGSKQHPRGLADLRPLWKDER